MMANHPIYGVIGYHVTLRGSHDSQYGVIGHHVTLSEGHMIANHPHIWGDRLSCDPLKKSITFIFVFLLMN